MSDFDAIVVGSGMSGGWVAKELCERGLKVLVLERGPEVVPARDYRDMEHPWEREHMDWVSSDAKALHPLQHEIYSFSESTRKYWVRDAEHPYETAPGTSYNWRRGYHLGGRSIMWARQSYRMGDLDFEANLRDGHGVDWPLRYADLAPWYDHVEEFAGISGSEEGLDQLPDGRFLPVLGLSCGEEAFRDAIEASFPGRRVIPGRTANLSEAREQHRAVGRGQCQIRNHCHQGCSFGAYFNSNAATLPAARATGNLTIICDAVVDSLEHDPQTNRITGVRVIDANTKAGRTYTARLVCLNASAIPTAMILLNSRSEANPRGLANRSDQVGRNLMDHVGGAYARGVLPGFEDKYHWGRRPNGFYIPRFRNVTEPGDGYVRGFGYQGSAMRGGWSGSRPGVGAAFKASNRTPGPWYLQFGAFGEVLPDENNRVSLHPSRRDQWGMPIPYIDARMGRNEQRMMEQASKDALAMAKAVGLQNIISSEDHEVTTSAPGNMIHEMGTARMGRDPRSSVLDGFGQSHDVPNLFVSDGAAMTSAACQNPSLTYMALAARAANRAADLLEGGAV